MRPRTWMRTRTRLVGLAMSRSAPTARNAATRNFPLGRAPPWTYPNARTRKRKTRPDHAMLAKLIVTALAMIAGGILLGLTTNLLLDTIAAILFATGSTILGVGAVLAIAILLRGLLFRSADRWTRFN
jgi:hypothetical protein